MNIGDNLNAIRKKKQMSESDLANLLDVSEKTVISWEIGTEIPNVNQLTTISDIFGVTIDEMIRGEIVPVDKKKRGRKQNSEMKEIQKSVRQVKKHIEDVMWITIVIIYLILGFAFELWHPGWLIFLIGAAIESYLTYLEKKSIEEMED